MGASVVKLKQIQNLIEADYKQEASLIIKGLLQEDPSDYDAWELLAEVTSGAAKDLCLQKAEFLRANNPKPGDDKTVPFVVEPRTMAKPEPPITPQIQKTKPKPVVQPPADANFDGSKLLRWSAIVAAGLALGILAIIFINQFFGGNQAVEAQSNTEPEMIAAVFDQSESEMDEQAAEGPEPTSTPEAEDSNDEAALENEEVKTQATLPPTKNPQPPQTTRAGKEVNL